MSDLNNTDPARRRDLLDAIGKASELHHHALLVLAVLIGAQGIAAAMGKDNVLMFIALIVSALTLGARLWVYQDLLVSVRMRLRPLLEGETPTPDAKTKQELDWLTQQDPWLERFSVWGLWFGAVFFAGGCMI